MKSTSKTDFQDFLQRGSTASAPLFSTENRNATQSRATTLSNASETLPLLAYKQSSGAFELAKANLACPIYADLDAGRFLKVPLKRNPRAKLIYVNQHIADLFGVTHEDIQKTWGVSVDDSKPAHPHLVGDCDTYNAVGHKPRNQLGSGRGLYVGGAFLKGCGLTPLAPFIDKKYITQMNTGTCPLYEGVKEALFGEVFKKGAVSSTEVLAIFDLQINQNDGRNYTGLMGQGSIVRIGDMTRIAHYTEGSCFNQLKFIVGPERSAIDWPARTGQFPRVEVLKKHAKTIAFIEFNRFWHGAADAGNTLLRGGFIDFGSITAQIDTAPRFWLNMAPFVHLENTEQEFVIKTTCFSKEYELIAEQLEILFPESRGDFEQELETQRITTVLGLFGMQAIEATQFIRSVKFKSAAVSFYNCWWELGHYYYYGDQDGRQSVSQMLSLVDIFGALGSAVQAELEKKDFDVKSTDPTPFKGFKLTPMQKEIRDRKLSISQYGVRVAQDLDLIFEDSTCNRKFNDLKNQMCPKLHDLLEAVTKFWKAHNEDLNLRYQLMIESITAGTCPHAALSREPLLKRYRSAYDAYLNAGDEGAIQRFLDMEIITPG